jgi:hypothetical protein
MAGRPGDGELPTAPDTAVAALATWVASVAPELAALVPPAPAAELGRLAVPAVLTPGRLLPPGRQRVEHDFRRRGGVPAWADDAADPGGGDQAVPTAGDLLRDLPDLLTERILGALELALARLDLTGAPDLSAWLVPPFPPQHSSVMGWMVLREPAAVTAVSLLEQIVPRIADRAVDVAVRVAAHPAVRGPSSAGSSPVDGVLVDGASGTDPELIAAAHGASRLATAMAVAAAVVGPLPPLPAVEREPATVGIGLAAAVRLLLDAGTPPGYEAAVLSRLRATYLVPHAAVGSVHVAGHRFLLVDGKQPDDLGDDAGFRENGLVRAVPGGLLVRAGVQEGHVSVTVQVVEGEPGAPEPQWEEVVELSWWVEEGLASVQGPSGERDPSLALVGPPWPGEYRVRVCALGRDDPDDGESYQFTIWRRPATPALAPPAHRATDLLGHRLRDEPAPDRQARPEHAYRWVAGGALGDAATVTVVTGARPEDVLRAFGADPQRPQSMAELAEELVRRGSVDPWVAVLTDGPVVIAVEVNGWQGADVTVLEQASASWPQTRAASMYWNVNAQMALSFAEGGTVLASADPGLDPMTDLTAHPGVRAALEGLDFDGFEDVVGKGLVAVERFTGRGITAEDVERLLDAQVAFRIVPQLPRLHPYAAWPAEAGAHPGHELLSDRIAVLLGLPAEQARELAWWIAAQTVQGAGLDGDPDVAATIAARAFTDAAAWRARGSQLDGGEHPWLWRALHRATNPDPVAAMLGVLDAGRYAVGPRAAELVRAARDRLDALAEGGAD